MIFTLNNVKIGQVFRNWDGKVCTLTSKSDSRAILEPDHREVSTGTEIIEVLPTEAFATDHKEGETQMATLKKDKEGHVLGAVRISICQDSNCEQMKVGQIHEGTQWPKKCWNCKGPVMIAGVGCENGEIQLMFKDNVLVGINQPKQKVSKIKGDDKKLKPAKKTDSSVTPFSKEQQIGKSPKVEAGGEAAK